MVLSPNVLKHIERKSLNGDYSDEERKPRSRKKTSRYIDESSREINLKPKRKSKPKPKQNRIKKNEKISMNLDSDSDCDSVVLLRSKFCKGPKRMRCMRNLEKEEIKRTNSFLSLSDDEDSSVDLTKLTTKANNHELIHGDIIGKKIITSQKRHVEDRMIEKQTKQVDALRDIKKRKSNTMLNTTVDNSNHVTNNFNISIDNSGSTNVQSAPPFSWTNNKSLPWMNHNLLSQPMIQDHTHSPDQYSLQQIQQSTQRLINPHINSTTSLSVESIIAELANNSINHTWIANYRRALEIRRAHGVSGLRRGYNSFDPFVSDWYARQRDYSLDSRKRMLMHELE